ncbi:hypothetical protein [Streptomyces sp. NRRL F-5053]|uniref:hypothetical protein n=1 Tax=Streptomyces sp. NRRL F-5053 TaxID=1463854 RepID=UPI001331A735|nr:hypothetical protein [Streptomyces sp. NRRL F-5053]
MTDSSDGLHRVRWSVPRADESTIRWLKLQNNTSQSLQLLVRESIQREGYTDVVNRPVDQLPCSCHGRPVVDGRPAQVEADTPARSDRGDTGAARTEVDASPRPGSGPGDEEVHQAAGEGAEPARLRKSKEAAGKTTGPEPAAGADKPHTGTSPASAAIEHLLNL